jgi:hypothetical protein
MRTVTCSICQKIFETSSSNAKYCSENCKREVKAQQHRERKIKKGLIVDLGKNIKEAYEKLMEAEKKLKLLEELEEECECEEWKDVVGYEDSYMISSLGRLLSKRGILKPSLASGYYAVNLYKEGVHKTWKIHRLVGLHFIPNPDELPEVDHKNRNKLDNSIQNLRWVSHRDNMINTDRVEFKQKVRELNDTYADGEKRYQVRYFPDGINSSCKNFKTYDEAKAFANEKIEEGLFYPR